MATLFENEHKHEESHSNNHPPQESGIIPSTSKKLTSWTHRFLEERVRQLESHFQSTDQTIKVSEILSSIAHLYEKIRNTIEYKGEFVLRRNAIERILRRLLWEHTTHDTYRIAEVLTREIIWARYLPNDRIPRRKIAEIASVINKYLVLIGKIKERGSPIGQNALREWMWGVASCEIEETLEATHREAFVTLMYEWFKEHFAWEETDLPQEEKDIQLYLAVHRALTKSDEAVMRYHLLLKIMPSWQTADELSVTQFATNFGALFDQIESKLSFPKRSELYRQVQKHVAPFKIIEQLVNEEKGKAAAIIADPNTFEEKVRDICRRKYAQIQRKVNRGIIRSILYIFMTKVLLALLIEIPYEMLRFGKLTYLPLAINVVVPPAMMWLVGLTITTPGADNTERLIENLKSIVYDHDHGVKAPFSLSPTQRDSLLTRVFAGLYFVLFLLVFGVITYVLLKLSFTWIGIFIFFAFLSLVLLFGFRVRFTASELKVTSDRMGFLGYLFNNVTLPFLSTGVVLSKGLAKINFLTVFLDFLIEAPLKTVIEVLEEWTSFIREKREEVVEVPDQ